MLRPPAERETCDNCGHDAVGAYCAACGQQNVPLRQPAHRFLAEAIVEYFGIDGQLWTSLGVLLFRPGALTEAYFAGRRVRYLRPLRLYLSATLAFFFLLSVLDPVEQVEGLISRGIESEEVGTVPAGARVAALDSALAASPIARREAKVDSLRARAGKLQASDAEALGVPEDDLAGEVDNPEDLRGDGISRRLRQIEWQRNQLAGLPPDSVIDAEAWDEASRLLYPEGRLDLDMPEWAPRSRPVERLVASRTKAERAAALADFSRSALAQLPTVMFVLLPVFALLLKLIYVRRGWFYSEHLVFGLHTHAFAFVVFALIAVLLGFGGGSGAVSLLARVLAWSIPLYFFLAQKRVYGQGWLKTGAKAVLLGGAYGLVLIAGLALAITLAAVV